MSPSEEPLAQFLETLSSGSPAPGGGAAAALAGALGASLVSMVANLTVGRRGYAAVESAMRQVQKEAVELRDRLSELLAEDIAAFNAVMAAYKLPTNEPTRCRRIEEALKGACEVPLETAVHCLRALESAEIVAKEGNKNAASDAAAAAALAEAGLEIALLNVVANLRSIEDEGFKGECERRRRELAAAGAGLKERTLEAVQRRLAG